MLEFNVSSILSGELSDLSGSRAEHGDNAAQFTWGNANREAANSPVLRADQIDDAKAWAAEFGAWDSDEIAAWSDDEVNALVIQYVAGDLRTAQDLCPGDGPGDIDWQAYEALCEAGTVSANIFANGTEVWASLC